MQAKKLSKPQPLPYELSLRIRHPSMDPAELSRDLKLEAKHSFRAGEPRQPRRDGMSASVHGESYWLGTIDPASWPADIWFAGFTDLELTQRPLRQAATNLGWALSLTATRFLRTNAALFERIRADGGQASLLVSLSPLAVESFSLTPEMSRIFGELAITIEFETTND
jgi:hypothetical protein